MTSLCFNAFTWSPYFAVTLALPDQIDAVAAAGFDSIGIDPLALEAFEASGGTPAALIARLAGAGIECGSIIAAGLIGTETAGEAKLRSAAIWADRLDAPFIQINSALARGGGAEEALEEACHIVAGVAPGSRLALEYLPFTPVSSLADTLALARHVGFDRCGALIDIWHHERGPDCWEDLAAVPLEAIAYIEFDDALPMTSDDMIEETVNRRIFPGEGVLDCGRFARTVRDLGYDGLVSIEVLNADWRQRDPVAFARRVAGASRQYW